MLKGFSVDLYLLTPPPPPKKKDKRTYEGQQPTAVSPSNNANCIGQSEAPFAVAVQALV